MTDPMFNPETGHGIECLCDGCMRGRGFDVPGTLTLHVESLGVYQQGMEEFPRIIKRVMTDGISTKDGLS